MWCRLGVRIVRAKDLADTSFLRDVLALDSIVYPVQCRDSYENVYARYRANHDTFYLLYARSKLIGYLCAFPITQELYQKMLTTKHSYAGDIQASDIVLYEQGKYHVLYIISIVLHPDYQSRGIWQLLMQEVYMDLLEKCKDGIHVEKILAIAVSECEAKLLRSQGFEVISENTDGGVLYELDLSA